MCPVHNLEMRDEPEQYFDEKGILKAKTGARFLCAYEGEYTFVHFHYVHVAVQCHYENCVQAENIVSESARRPTWLCVEHKTIIEERRRAKREAKEKADKERERRKLDEVLEKAKELQRRKFENTVIENPEVAFQEFKTKQAFEKLQKLGN